MKKILVTLLVSIALSACGGAGTPTLREGLYMGTSLDFFDLTGSPSTVLALEGGEVWALLGGYQIVFFGQGTFAYTRTEPSPSTPTVDIFSQSKALGALRSNLLGEVSLTAGQGETPYGNAMSVLTPARSQSESAGGREATIERGFNYNKPASLQEVAGTWGTRNGPTSFVDSIDPQNRALTVAASGAISAPPQTSGCSLSGTLTPRASGKNVFTLRLTLAGCASSGDYAGVAFSYMDSAGYSGAGPFIIPTFRLIAINSDKTKMFAMTTAR
jgi:hypothetical protein